MGSKTSETLKKGGVGCFPLVLIPSDQGAIPGDSTVRKPRCSMPESGLVAIRAEIL